jgi:hypothetical protein
MFPSEQWVTWHPRLLLGYIPLHLLVQIQLLLLVQEAILRIMHIMLLPGIVCSSKHSSKIRAWKEVLM